MTGLVTSLLLGALSAHATPPQMTLGRDPSAQLELLALTPEGRPYPGAVLTVTASLGTVGAVQDLGGGRFRARYLPPKERFAQVALLLFELQSGPQRFHQWLSLPLEAKASLKIETKPRASVTVTLGETVFGPVVADARGRATVPAVVPPGATSAMVRATDRAGNATDLPLDLGARPTPRLRMRLSRAAASWADTAPLELEVFAVDASGQPAATAAGLSASAREGRLGPPVQRAPGVFVYTYQPLEKLGSGREAFEVSLEGSPLHAGAEAALAPGPEASIQVRLTPGAYRAGSHVPIRVETVRVDAHGNPVPRALEPVVTAELGRMERAGSERHLLVPDAFEGHTRDRVLATGEGLRGEAGVELQPGPPSKVVASSGRPMVRAGELLELSLQMADAWGNPAEGGALQVRTPEGALGQVTGLGAGRYLLHLETPTSTPPGDLELEILRDGVALAHPAVTVLPYVRPWALSLGLFASGQTTFRRASALGLRGEVGLAVPRSRLELLVGGEVLAYARFHQAAPELGTGATIIGSTHAEWVGVGGRYSVPVSPRAALFATALVGAQATSSLLTLSTDATLRQSEVHWGALLRMGGGASRTLGRGRMLVELEYVYALAGGQLQGSLGGLALTAGYAFGF